MIVRRIESYDDFRDLEPAWNTLAAGVPFRSFAWIDSWWRHLGQGDLYTLAVYDGESLVGIAPWYREESASRGRVIRFLGSGDVCSDYLSLLVEPHREAEVFQALSRWLSDAVSSSNDHWDLLHWEQVPVHDKTLVQFARQVESDGSLVHRQANSSCWRIWLPASWEDYLTRVSKSHRKQLRRVHRHLLENGRTRLHVATRAQFDSYFDTLVELHQRRRESLAQAGCFDSEKFTSFLREATRRLIEQGACDLHVLKVGERPVAAEVHLRGNDVVYAYQSGIDPDRLDLEPGRALTIAAIQLAIQNGARGYDFCRGDEVYKRHWRATPTATHDVRVVPDRKPAQLRHGVWLAGHTVKHWLKTSLKRPTNRP